MRGLVHHFLGAGLGLVVALHCSLFSLVVGLVGTAFRLVQGRLGALGNSEWMPERQLVTIICTNHGRQMYGIARYLSTSCHAAEITLNHGLLRNLLQN